MAKNRRRGFSLVEILIASIILAVTGVGVLTIFSSSTGTIDRTDARREYRFYLKEILAHVNRQSLHKLFFHYGPLEQRAKLNNDLAGSRLLGKIAAYDENGVMQDPASEMTNPLGFTQAFIKQLALEKLQVSIQFEFLRRNEDLNIQPNGGPSKEVGLLHMQAGKVRVELYQEVTFASDGSTDEIPVASIEQPIMCPAIVGRPGLKLSSCPAISQKVKCAYLPILEEVEGFEAPPQDVANCNRPEFDGITPMDVTVGQSAQQAQQAGG